MSDSGLTFVEYWRLRMDGLALQLEAALKLIKHNVTRGGLAENILRDQISEFLPKKWTARSGFIVDKFEKTSRQIDILLYDCLNGLPVYQDEYVVVLAPDTARVAIEVKSQLDAKGIYGAFENIRSVRSLDPNIKGFVFGYDGVAADTFAGHVQDWLKTELGTQAFEKNLLPEGCFNLGKKFVVTPPVSRKNDKDDKDEVFAVSTATQNASEYLLQQLWGNLEMRKVKHILPSIELGPVKVNVFYKREKET